MPAYIDQRGELLETAEAGRGIALRGDALARYLIVNIGLVEVHAHGAACQVRLRPAMSEPTSLIALLYWLADRKPRSIRLSTYHDGWQQRTFSSLGPFITFISAFVDGQGRGDWLNGGRHLRRACRPASSPFGRIAAKARMIAWNIDDLDVAVGFLRRSFTARWSICQLDHERLETMVLAKSADYTPFNARFDRSAMSSLAGYADRSYGLSIARLHHDAVQTMRARYEDVDCVARFEGIGDVRMRYHSFTMPVLKPNGSVLLVCGSRDNPMLDLRQPLQREPTQIVN